MNEQRNILFVEDDTDDFYFVEDAFAKVDPAIHVLRATNGSDVVSILGGLPDTELPVLIILDSQMSLLSGLDTLRYINATMRYQPIPKIIYTGSDYKPYIEICLANGASGYIQKGSTLEENLAKVKQMLAYCR